MPRQVYFYDPPERFVAGTVGEPGSRTFFLQARGAGRITSVALEKQQVALLAEQIDKLLDEVLRVTAGDVPVPPPVDAVDDLDPLEGPIEEDFRVGTLALGWDPSAERLVIVAQAPGEDDPEGTGPALDDEEDNPEGPDVLRVRLTGEMARAFARRAQSVVSAGRPSCPFCGLPLDPAGHICPRANGYRR